MLGTRDLRAAIVAVVLVGGAASGCSAVRDQFVAQNVNGCVKKNCDEREAAARKQCESACLSAYGR